MIRSNRRVVASGDAICPELLLLLACGSVDSEWGRTRLNHLLASPLNWPRLVELTDWNSMAPLLSRALRERDLLESAPPEAIKDLRTIATAKTLRALGMARELARVTAALEAAGIPTLAFKGPTLAKLAYGDLGLRDSTDLDLFVPRKNLKPALDVMARLDYAKKTPAWDPDLPGASEIALRRGEPNFEVDLHWLFTPKYFLRFDPERAMGRSVRIEIAGFQTRTLRPEDLLRYLCIHAAFEGWAMARFVVDIGRILERCPVDWDDAIRESTRDGSWRALATGVSLACRLCGAAVPIGVARRIETDSAVGRCVAAALRAIALQSQELGGSAAGLKVHVAVLTGSSAKFNYFWRRALQPNHLDAQWVRLPAGLEAGYYLLRPVRLAQSLIFRLLHQ